MSTIQYTYNYQLTLDGRGFAGDKDVILQNDKNTTTIYSDISMTLSLYGVTFRRKVYEPGSIQAEIMIQTKDTALPTVDLLTTMLIRRPVSLSIEKSHYEASKKKIDGTPTVAKNYYIHEISPQFEKRTTRVEDISKGGGHTEKNVSYNWIYIKLEIFSLDKLLTLSKYSQAHFGETLFGDILKNNIDSFQLRFKKTADSTTTISVPIEIETDTTKLELNHLYYLDGTTQVELIQPYLVQYNESFYDFLRRTANRCGEVFYFENGKFCVGVSKAVSTPIDDTSRVVFQRISEGALDIGDYARDSLKQRSGNTYELGKNKVISDPIDKGDDDFPTDAFPATDLSNYNIHPFRYNSEVASEDHYMMLFKDKFAKDSVHDLWCGDGTEHVMRTISQLLNSTSLMEFATNASLKELESLAKAAAKSNKTNEKWLDLFKEYRNADADKTAVIPKTKVDRTKWITLNYVKDIRDFEQAQMRGMVCVDMGTGFSNVKLGDKITLPSPNHKKTYVVVQIDMSSGQDWQRTYDGFVGRETPMRGEQSQRIYAIPMAKKVVDSTETEVFYPPLLPGEPFRRSGAQPAFVIDSKDPAGQGRVRIRYPWQPHYDKSYKDINLTSLQTAIDTAQSDLGKAKTELEKYTKDPIVIPEEGQPEIEKADNADDNKYKEAKDDFWAEFDKYRSAVHSKVVGQARLLIQEAGSPWIRMATPMATSGGGMFFCPEKGDEVMVDFENGNVERPYVTGTLYSKNVPAPKEGGRVIVSKNGHTIKMSDPSDGTDLLAGMLPAVKFLQTFGALDDTKIGMGGDTVEMLGGIELTDQLGLYNIKMSSHDRLISIASPFGNVNISALTGISIEAPNGDITISGKNIDITAYNKLSITSGKNIKLAKDKDRAGWLTTGADASDAGKQIGKAITKLFGIGKWLDLSLVRTLLEIFIRPIDGTLSLKAYRFMTLEAGGGSTSINPALYESHRTDAYKQCRDVKALEMMMLYIRDTVEGYIDTYEELFNKVQGDYQAVKRCYTVAGGPQITTPASGTDLLKNLFHDIDCSKKPKELNSDRDSFVETAASFAIAAAITDETLKNSIKTKVKTLFDSVCALKKHVLNYSTMFSDTKSGLWKAHSDAKVSKAGAWEQAKSFTRVLNLDLPTLSGSILRMLDPTLPLSEEVRISTAVAARAPLAAFAVPAVVNPTPTQLFGAPAQATGFLGDCIETVEAFINQTAADDSLFNNPVSVANYVKWRKYIRRRLACAVIEKCRTNNPFASVTIAPAEYKPTEDASAAPPTYKQTEPVNMAHPFSNTDWTLYVNEIKITSVENDAAKATRGENFVTGMFESLTEAAKKIFPGESLVWKQEAKGQILLSDQKGKTFHFKENGQTDSYENLDKSLVDDVPSLLNTLRTFV